MLLVLLPIEDSRAGLAEEDDDDDDLSDVTAVDVDEKGDAYPAGGDNDEDDDDNDDVGSSCLLTTRLTASVCSAWLRRMWATRISLLGRLFNTSLLPTPSLISTSLLSVSALGGWTKVVGGEGKLLPSLCVSVSMILSLSLLLLSSPRSSATSPGGGVGM